MKCLLFILFAAFSAMAATDPWVSVIQDAQKEVVAKNRKAATEKLISSLKAEKWSPKGKVKILESLKSLSEVFFTDQGQRLYETGQSQTYENPDSALAKFKEALGVEDGNMTILLSVVRVQLSKKDCASADLTLKIASEMNPYDDTLRFLQAKSLLCQHKPKEALALLKTDSTEDPVSNVTYASAMFENGSAREALDLLQKTAGKDPGFPESHYWIWKVSEEKNDPAKADAAEDQAQKYVALCKNLNLRTRRKYINEPRLCGQTQEVEDALKASPKNSEN
jgi:predicted Zn-dependent protease